MRTRSKPDGGAVRAARFGSHVSVLLGGPMTTHFLFGGEAQTTDQTSVTSLVAGSRLTVETVMSK